MPALTPPECLLLANWLEPLLAVAFVQGGFGAAGSQFCGGTSGVLELGPANVVMPLAGPHQPKPAQISPLPLNHFCYQQSIRGSIGNMRKR